MSDWGDDDFAGTPFAEQPRSSHPDPRTPEVDQARQAQDKAATALHDAVDAVADAESAVRVAEAKSEDYSGDESKATWQLVSAAEDVEKARRLLARRQVAQQRRKSDLAEASDELAQTIELAILLSEEPEEEPPPPPELYYVSVDEFVREYLRNVYRRAINGRSRVWAARWWEYDEAVIRLESLWRSWEHLRLDPSTGMSVWWRDHADHHMAVLMDPDGPFAAADANTETNHSRKGEPLPYEAPPAGLFADERDFTQVPIGQESTGAGEGSPPVS